MQYESYEIGRNIRKEGVFSILLTYNDKQESSLRGKNGVKMA